MDSRTLSEQIRDELINLIAQGYFRPGERLRQEHLCKQFGFTYTPLREALRALASQGVLEYAPNRGYRVPSFTYDEIREIFEAREALEGMAMRLLAHKITDQQLTELAQLANEYMAIIQAETNAPEAVPVDMEFHRRIAQWCGNKHIANLILGSHILTRSMLVSRLPSQIVRPGPYTDHNLLVQALQARNPDEAERIMRMHIRDAGERLLQSLQAQHKAQARGVAGHK